MAHLGLQIPYSSLHVVMWSDQVQSGSSIGLYSGRLVMGYFHSIFCFYCVCVCLCTNTHTSTESPTGWDGREVGPRTQRRHARPWKTGYQGDTTTSSTSVPSGHSLTSVMTMPSLGTESTIPLSAPSTRLLWSARAQIPREDPASWCGRKMYMSMSEETQSTSPNKDRHTKEHTRLNVRGPIA